MQSTCIMPQTYVVEFIYRTYSQTWSIWNTEHSKKCKIMQRLQNSFAHKCHVNFNGKTLLPKEIKKSSFLRVVCVFLRQCYSTDITLGVIELIFNAAAI